MPYPLNQFSSLSRALFVVTPSLAACSFAEIEVIPTTSVFYSRDVSEWTLRNMGKARQDERGYLVEDSYVSGFLDGPWLIKEDAMALMFRLKVLLLGFFVLTFLTAIFLELLYFG